jgi:hypothetical protein
MRIGCVSDVCLGYGSPQIGYLVSSLCEYYQSENLVVEPHHRDLPPRHNRFPGLRIQRARNVIQPYSEAGRVEYLIEAARMMEDYAPDLLVICCTFCLPVLFRLRKRPAFVIYYSYESIPFYGSFDVEMNRHAQGMIDLVIFPEENRAVREVERFGFRDISQVVLYNCPNAEFRTESLTEPRNGRIIYFGTIDRKMTFAEYYTKPEAQKYPIDLYGPVRTASEEERQGFLRQIQGQVRYCGYLDNKELEPVRRQYTYSLVLWNPSVENQLYAAPNKFFESIIDGIPPLAAPHPQCKMLLNRYGCGLLMPDWSFDGFCETLEKALRIRQSSAWREMVDNCKRAAELELNWNHQFEKLKRHLRN